MKQFVLFILLIFVAVALAVAQQPAAASEDAVDVVPQEQQATKEDIVALMDVLHSRRTTTAAIDTMKKQMLDGMRSSFLQEHPGASPEVVKRLEAIMDGVWKVINIDELVSVSIPIYQKYLSHEDAVSIISFYSSPSGQHYLSRMPALIKEAGEAGGNVMRGHMEEIQRSAKEKYAEFEKYVAAHPEELGTPAKSSDN